MKRRKSLGWYTVFGVNISEDRLMSAYPKAFTLLLRDNTMSTEQEQRNIFWATDNYEALGEGYGYNDPIEIEFITGLRGKVIMPRVLKEKRVQRERIKGKAEVFTPSWICNKQNNILDDDWFEREGVFNTENDDKTWTTNYEKIEFPKKKGKSWYDYVRRRCLEMACGEAPYLASRYDATTGKPIAIGDRIGLLDRKLRVVSENVESTWLWIKWAKEAVKAVYGFEWQGDSLFIARESLFTTFIEYYIAKFGKKSFHHIKGKVLPEVARIISWNLWQMDGLKGVIPNSCGKDPLGQNLFNEGELRLCPGCQSSNVLEGMRKHNGIKCNIMNWRAGKAGKPVRFVDLIKNKER